MVNFSLNLNLADIESTKYGTAKNLQATLPLLTGGSYEVPKLCSDRKKLMTIATELATNFRDHWPTSTDEEAILKAAQALLMVTYQCPTLDWETDPSFRAIVDMVVTSIALDDVVDRLLQIHPGAKHLKMFLASAAMMMKSDMDFEPVFSKFKDEDPASSMNLFGIMITRMQKSIKALGQLGTKEGQKSVDHTFVEVLATTTAIFCTLLEKASESTRFSQQGFKRHVGQSAHGQRYFLEVNHLVAPGPGLSPEIRNSLLFKMLMDSFGNGTALINAICGVSKDVRDDTWGDTTILRDVVLKGLTLQESWDNAVQDFAGEVHDMNLAMDLLRDTYEDEEGLEEFLQIFYDTFMGTCFVYADEFASSRYLGTSVEVLTSDEESEIILPAGKDPMELKVTILGAVDGIYFGVNNDGLASTELLISDTGESLGLHGLRLGIKEEEKTPNQQA